MLANPLEPACSDVVAGASRWAVVDEGSIGKSTVATASGHVVHLYAESFETAEAAKQAGHLDLAGVTF